MDTTITHKRIEYIDALRGFTMLLVIFSHVELFGFGLLPEQSALNTLFIKFRMPLFFFISGFLVYRVGTIWTGNYYLSVVQKKLFAQIVPTLIFGLLYTYLIQHQNILTFIAHPLKMGYWFTISLFEILVIYYTINYLAHILFPSRENGGGGCLCLQPSHYTSHLSL